MGKQPITELKDKKILNNEVGEELYIFLLVKKVELKIAKNDQEYLDMVVCNQDNILNVKKFDLTENEKSIQPGEVIKIRGTIGVYRDEPQLKILQFRRAKKDEVSIDDLVPSAERSGDDMYKEILGYINDIEDADYRSLVKSIYEENKDELMKSAAALHMHHMIRGGLLLHITTMARLGISFSIVYPWMNKDLLMTGILLHDIGKLRELKREDTGLAEDFTKEGKLLGHLEIGCRMIDRKCYEMNLSEEKTLDILHMIASHHGEPEFGTIVLPITPEAQMLHYIDLMDSKMYAYKDALDSIKPGEFSEKVYALKNKNVYKVNL